MRKILIICDQDYFKNIYEVNFITYLDAPVEFSGNMEDAQQKLNDNEYGLVVIRHKLPLSFEISVPVIFLGDNDGKDNAKENMIVRNLFDIKPLIQTAAQILEVTALEMVSKEVPDYFPLPINGFRQIKTSPSNIFKAHESGSYVLAFSQHQPISQKVLESLISENHNKLYVEKQYRLSFVNYLTSENIANIPQDSLSDAEKVQASEKNFKFLKEKVKQFGLTEETIQLARENFRDVNRMAKSSPSMKSLIKRLLQNTDDYLYKHVQLISFFGHHLLNELEWGQKKEVKQTFSFVAFFHDIMLEDEEQAKIHSNDELKNSGLSPEKKKLVERHAHLAAEMANKFPKAPLSADTILKQHHGTTNGHGFSDHFSANLSPMAITFIICEELANNLLEEGEGFDNGVALNRLKEKFKTKRFEKTISILEKITMV